MIDTGLYGIVRHPMYSSPLILFLSMAFVLASPISFAILLFYIPIAAKRIKNEETVLLQDLEGYAEYREKVKYNAIPSVWRKKVLPRSDRTTEGSPLSAGCSERTMEAVVLLHSGKRRGLDRSTRIVKGRIIAVGPDWNLQRYVRLFGRPSTKLFCR